MKLVIANKNYSSWSLRAWLALKATGASFEETMVLLDTQETKALIAEHSPAGRVPVLIDGPTVVWDSLAITEYLAERFPEARLWPAAMEARAHARAIAAEMHAGFAALRQHLPMNIRRTPAERPLTDGAAADVERVRQIWIEARGRFGAGGPFLFGAFTAADCFYAPVVSRFATYKVAVGEIEAAYMDAILDHSAMREWAEAALEEPWIVPSDEVD